LPRQGLSIVFGAKRWVWFKKLYHFLNILNRSFLYGLENFNPEE